MIDWLIRILTRTAAKSGGSFVVDAEFERSEELRPDRLGLTGDMMVDEGWKPPHDEWRPSTTLG